MRPIFKIHPLFWSLGLLVAARCNHRYYAPNTIQMPVFTEKNQVFASAGLSVGPEFDGFEASASYSPVKYGAVMVNYFSAGSDKNKTGPEGLIEWGKGRFLEGAVGGYCPLDERNTLSLFAGFGKGNTYNYFGENRFADLRFQRFFLQPSISAQFRLVRLGFGLRLAHLRITKGLVDYQIDPQERQIIEQLVNDSPLFLPEYALQFGWRIGPVTLNNTVTYSPSRAAQKDNRFVGSNLNMALLFDLHRLWKKH